MKNLALVTGATGGIGAAIAKQLMAEGYSVLLTGRSLERLEQVSAELRSEHPTAQIEVVSADVTTASGRDAIVACIGSLQRALDLIVNNAGAGLFGLLEDLEAEQLETLFTTNVVAPILLTQAVLKAFVAQNPKLQVINVGSTFGSIGYPGFSSYCATKFALRGFSQALAREYGDTAVQVRYFAPRATQTALNSDAVNAMNQELKVAVDTPEVVATQFAAFLRSKNPSAHIGWPERFFVWLNQLSPGTVTSALIKQLPVIKRHARATG